MNQLELILEPVPVENGETYLEKSYTFSSVANGEDHIIIGRIDPGNIKVELSRKNKLFIPSLSYVPNIDALIKDCENKDLQKKFIEELDKIYDKINYPIISRNAVKIIKMEIGYSIKSMGENEIEVYPPKAVVGSVYTELKDGMIIEISGILRFGVKIKDVTQLTKKENKTSRIARFE